MYDEHWALHHVSFSISSGKMALLQGANGSGKSTLLRIASTLAFPSIGETFYNGIPLQQISQQRLRGEIGFLMHEPAFFAECTVFENIFSFARLQGLSSKDSQIQARHWIEQMDLGAVVQKQARALSRGLLQRMALIRAFIHGPSVLLLDEPYTALDVHIQSNITCAIQAAKQAGALVLLSTHDASVVSDLADVVLHLKNGRLQAP